MTMLMMKSYITMKDLKCREFISLHDYILQYIMLIYRGDC